MRMNDKENNAMVRDFSGEAKQELLQYVDSIISKQRWEVYWEMDPLYRDSSMRKAEIFMADGVSLTQILEILMQLAQYI